MLYLEYFHQVRHSIRVGANLPEGMVSMLILRPMGPLNEFLFEALFYLWAEIQHHHFFKQKKSTAVMVITGWKCWPRNVQIESRFKISTRISFMFPPVAYTSFTVMVEDSYGWNNLRIYVPHPLFNSQINTATTNI